MFKASVGGGGGGAKGAGRLNKTENPITSCTYQLSYQGCYLLFVFF